MKEMPFLINPPAGGTRRRRKRRPAKSATKRRVKAAKTGVATMAKKRHRRHVTRRRNPPAVHHRRSTRRRHRRNPPMMGGIVKTLTGGVVDAAWGIGGKATARFASTKLGFLPGSMTSLLVEAGVGVVGAMALRRFAPAGTRAFLQGAFMAPLETLAVTNNVPLLSTYLGGYNDGALLMTGQYNTGAVNPGVQTGAFAGYPRQVQLQGYPPQMSGYAEDNMMGDYDSMAGRFGR